MITKGEVAALGVTPFSENGTSRHSNEPSVHSVILGQPVDYYLTSLGHLCPSERPLSSLRWLTETVTLLPHSSHLQSICHQGSSAASRRSGTQTQFLSCALDSRLPSALGGTSEALEGPVYSLVMAPSHPTF